MDLNVFKSGCINYQSRCSSTAAVAGRNNGGLIRDVHIGIACTRGNFAERSVSMPDVPFSILGVRKVS